MCAYKILNATIWRGRMSDLGNDVGTNAMASKNDWAAEQTTGFLLWNLGNIWQREQRRALSPTASHRSISPAPGTCSQIRRPETVSQIALARHCRTDPMMTSQVVRALIRLGYVERTRDRRDKRAFAVRLTAKGREIGNAPNLIFAGSTLGSSPSSARHTGLHRRITSWRVNARAGGCKRRPETPNRP